MWNSGYWKLLNFKLLRSFFVQISIKRLKKTMWELLKTLTYCCLKETETSYGQKIVFSDNPEQNIWQERKSNQIAAEQKTLISAFT